MNKNKIVLKFNEKSVVNLISSKFQFFSMLNDKMEVPKCYFSFLISWTLENESSNESEILINLVIGDCKFVNSNFPRPIKFKKKAKSIFNLSVCGWPIFLISSIPHPLLSL